MNTLKRLLGFILHVANSSPPILRKGDFYELKTWLLQKWGTPDGFDVQHIQKLCWSCDGSGIYKHWRYGRIKCNRCYHGWYQDDYIRLDRYMLGNFLFHHPVKRWPGYLASESFKALANITGYVEHTRYFGHMPSECAHWLFLVFRPHIFANVFGHTGHSWRGLRWYMPLCIIETVLFDWWMHVASLENWHHLFRLDGTSFGTSQELEESRITSAMQSRRWRREVDREDPRFDLVDRSADEDAEEEMEYSYESDIPF